MKIRNDPGMLDAVHIRSGSASRDSGGSAALGSRLESSIEDTIEDK